MQIIKRKVYKLTILNNMKNKKLIYDTGVNDIGLTRDINYKRTKWYNTWKGMIGRCYDSKIQLKQPTYIGCTICDEWKLASNFKLWFDKQVIAHDSELDKDILFHGNNIYSANTCRFIPKCLNTLFCDCGSTRGEFPIGVNYDKKHKKYNSRIRIFGDTRWLGYFTTPEEASRAYKIAKLTHCITLSEQLFADGRISKEIADAVVNKANILFNN